MGKRGDIGSKKRGEKEQNSSHFKDRPPKMA
jgi:hypothetical protein